MASGRVILRSLRGYVFLLLVSVCLLISCKKESQQLNAPQNYTGTSFQDIFESFWNGMNNNYVFWGIDSTHWDNMYNTYKPVFAQLNVNEENDQKKAVGYFRQMVSGLIDGHFTISFPGLNYVQDSQIDPAFERKLRSPGYHDPIPLGYFFFDLPGNYLDSGYLKGVDSTNASGLEVTVEGTIRQHILYFYFSLFELERLFNTSQSEVQPVIQKFLQTLQNMPAGINGIILDVRSNGGGDVNDLDFLVGRMITSPLIFGDTRAKNGPGRLDYSPWAPAIVTPQAGSTHITLPIVVLADNFSASMAELTVMAIRALPGNQFVGETTWGANGPLAPNVYFNGGEFNVGIDQNLSVRTSSTMFRYKNGQIYEGKGFPPDFAVPYNLNALKQGVDLPLEKAISLLQ